MKRSSSNWLSELSFAMLVGTAMLCCLFTQECIAENSANVPATEQSVAGSVDTTSAQNTVTASATTPSASPTTPSVLASGELNTGEPIEIMELKRTSGDTVTLKFTVKNTGTEELELKQFGNGSYYDWNVDKVHLLDLANKKKYMVLTDSEKNPITTRGTGDNSKLKPGAKITLWAKFQAPPVTVSKITVEIPNAAPFEDLPISG